MDNHLKKQLEKTQTWFCKYFPKRIRNVGEKEVADRQMVYDFKDGRSFEAVAQMTAASLKEQYGDGCKDITFVPVPASTSEKNELRYKAFCERVCELTGAINGYEHVKVIGGRLAIHENRKLEKEIRKVSIIEFDEIWFKGKNIVTFDDVITRGITWATYSDQLENLGAHVLSVNLLGQRNGHGKGFGIFGIRRNHRREIAVLHHLFGHAVDILKSPLLQ